MNEGTLREFSRRLIALATAGLGDEPQTNPAIFWSEGAKLDPPEFRDATMEEVLEDADRHSWMSDFWGAERRRSSRGRY